MKSVCVIGAGIVGCATAYQLARRGYKVHLVDGADGAGKLTSFANGAQLSYSYVEPFASPATLRALPGLLLARKSAVTFRLRADWRQWMWGLHFLGSCTSNAAREGTVKLLQLASRSRKALHAWIEEEDWAVDFCENGKLVLCSSVEMLERQQAQVALQAALGCKQEVLSALECTTREPALVRSSQPFAGGVWTADECVADPYLLCQQMVSSVQRLGGKVTFNTVVESLDVRDRRITGAKTSAGSITADTFVLCGGPMINQLAATIGLHLPIHPIKGYSITVPFASQHALRPKASVTDLGRKTVLAPLGDKLRVAAAAEVGEYGTSVPKHRVAEMIDAVNTLYPGVCDLRSPTTWAGLRPATPNSVPLISVANHTNLFINSGHGALGLTLAAGSAAELCDIVDSSQD